MASPLSQHLRPDGSQPGEKLRSVGIAQRRIAAAQQVDDNFQTLRFGQPGTQTVHLFQPGQLAPTRAAVNGTAQAQRFTSALGVVEHRQQGAVLQRQHGQCRIRIAQAAFLRRLPVPPAVVRGHRQHMPLCIIRAAKRQRFLFAANQHQRLQRCPPARGKALFIDHLARLIETQNLGKTGDEPVLHRQPHGAVGIHKRRSLDAGAKIKEGSRNEAARRTPMDALILRTHQRNRAAAPGCKTVCAIEQPQRPVGRARRDRIAHPANLPMKTAQGGRASAHLLRFAPAIRGRIEHRAVDRCVRRPRTAGGAPECAHAAILQFDQRYGSGCPPVVREKMCLQPPGWRRIGAAARAAPELF